MLPTLWWKEIVANSDDDEHGDGPLERERQRVNFQNNEF